MVYAYICKQETTEGHTMARNDYSTHTERDAGEFERRFGDYTEVDRPTLGDVADEVEVSVADYYAGPDDLPAGGIRCAHCKARHATVADVRWCKDLSDEMHAEAAAEQAAELASEQAFARSLEARAERGGPDVEAEQAEAFAQAAEDERIAESKRSWEYQNRWGRAENE
jgi:hypothetical protein